MRTPEERELAHGLRSSVQSVDVDDAFLASIVNKGLARSRRAKMVVSGAVALGVIAVAAVGSVVWNRSMQPDETAAIPSSEPTSGVADSFDITKETVLPILAAYALTEGDIALNQETGEAVLYLPDSDTVDISSVLTEVQEAVEATPGAAPLIAVTGTSLTTELRDLAIRIFDERDEWATDPVQVYYTIPRPPSVSVIVGVGDIAVAETLPATVQLPSGATASIVVEETRPPEFEEEAGPGALE